MRTKLKWSCVILSIVVVVLMTLSLLSVAGVQAQEGGPPVFPCIFYGNVTIDEKPAPAGTEITAKMDNKTCGNITVTEEGRYGGPRGGDPKLLVIGTAEDENKIISFFVDGAKAEENATWNSGEVYNLDLSVKKAAVTEGEGLPLTVVIGIVVVVAVALALILVGVKMRKR